MKHLLRGLFIAVLIICCNFQSVFAQPMQQMPVDKNVRIGKLDNGLTYYIRHNALPEKPRRILHRTKSRFYSGRTTATWLGSLSGTHGFQRDQTFPPAMKPDLESFPGVKLKVLNSEQT